jgi:hypothetical protein
LQPNYPGILSAVGERNGLSLVAAGFGLSAAFSVPAGFSVCGKLNRAKEAITLRFMFSDAAYFFMVISTRRFF